MSRVEHGLREGSDYEADALCYGCGGKLGTNAACVTTNRHGAEFRCATCVTEFEAARRLRTVTVSFTVELDENEWLTQYETVTDIDERVSRYAATMVRDYWCSDRGIGTGN